MSVQSPENTGLSTSPQRIFISGVAGFIPSTLAKTYLEQGHQVVGLDNFLTGSRSNIQQLQGHSNFQFIEQDVTTDLDLWKDRVGKVDRVFHLASPASPLDFEKIPLEIMEVNSRGTRNTLELAHQMSARFLLASTSEVYGDPEIHPQVEDYRGNVNCLGPRAPYDESKRFSEAMTMAYHRLHQLDVRIVRIFNTYGPKMRPDDGRVIPNFINQALNNQDITIYGDGQQSRSFCYVEDLVRAMDLVMNCDDIGPFNIGNTEEFSIAEVAKLVLELVGQKSTITYHPLPTDDPIRRRPNLSKLEKATGYKPVVPFRQGLAQTINYFKELLN